MNHKTENKVTQLLVFGLLLAAVKLIYSFFDFTYIFDFVVFLIAGIIFGGKTPTNQSTFGLLLALPAFILCLFFVIRLGYASIVNGVGTSYAISLVVIPLATAIGLFVHAKLSQKKLQQKKE